MKIQKIAITAAALSVVAVPVVAQADNHGAEFTLSGQVAILLQASDLDGPAGDPVLGGDDSSLNVAVTNTMDNGMTAYANYRLDAALTDSTPAADAVRVGIKGDFGDLRVGDANNPIRYGQMANDALTDIGDAGFSDQEEQAISYTKAFGPAEVAVMYSPINNRDTIGAGGKVTFSGLTIGAGFGEVGDGPGGDDANDITVSSFGASYGIAGATVSAAFKDFDNGLETIGAQVKYGIDKISLGLTFEAMTSDDSRDGDSIIRLDAGYDLGGNMAISTRINVISDDTVEAGLGVVEETNYRIMLNKTF